MNSKLPGVTTGAGMLRWRWWCHGK